MCLLLEGDRSIRKGSLSWNDNEPTVEELKDAIGDPSGYDEVVFCGFGESTERLDVLKEIAGYLKERGSKVRLDTNGLGDLINGRSICEELGGFDRHNLYQPEY